MVLGQRASFARPAPILGCVLATLEAAFAAEPRGKYDVAQWVGWQLANQGPKLGEQGHFRRAAESGNNGDLT